MDGEDLVANAASLGFLVFLGYLGAVTLGITHFAVQVLRTRRQPETIRTPFLLGVTYTMMAGSVVVAAWALLLWSQTSFILLALSPIGILAGRDILRYAWHGPREKMEWWYQHMGAMLGAGIAFHTAFLVFGSRVVLDLTILGPFNWVPWVAPAIVGTVAGRYWEQFYRRKFGDMPEASAV